MACRVQRLGTNHGGQVSFTTGVPSASTRFVLSTSATTAKLEGQVNPAGQSTTYHAAYGPASSEWCSTHGSAGTPEHSSTPATLGFTDAAFHNVSVELASLTRGSEYCAEIIAVNFSGTAHGGQVNFTSGIPSASTFNATSTSATVAKLEGQVNPAGQSTTYHVVYGLASLNGARALAAKDRPLIRRRRRPCLLPTPSPTTCRSN